MDYKLILDAVIILLLVATICYAVTLNRQLHVLRRNRDELAKLIGTFNEATLRAEAGVPKLRKAIEEASEELQGQIDKAVSLRDDLAFMLERAEGAADRLERTPPRAGANPSRPPPPPPPPVSASAATVAAAMSVATPVAPPQSRPRIPRAEPEVPRGMPRSLMEGLAAARKEAGADDGRSQAERDLLRALRSIR